MGATIRETDQVPRARTSGPRASGKVTIPGMPRPDRQYPLKYGRATAWRRSRSERETVKPPSQRERAEKQRNERLELMDKQVADGSLTIRQMSAAEKKKWEEADANGRTRRSKARKT
jgi:hypothetical protein